MRECSFNLGQEVRSHGPRPVESEYKLLFTSFLLLTCNLCSGAIRLNLYEYFHSNNYVINSFTHFLVCFRCSFENIRKKPFQNGKKLTKIFLVTNGGIVTHEVGFGNLQLSISEKTWISSLKIQML